MNDRNMNLQGLDGQVRTSSPLISARRRITQLCLICVIVTLLAFSWLLSSLNAQGAFAEEAAGDQTAAESQNGTDEPDDEAGSDSSAAVEEENATEKSEVVYARLSTSGSVEDVYVVNVLEPDSPGVVKDYGDYTSVQNLTDATKLIYTDGFVAIDVDGDDFTYQGDMGKAELPWEIAITATLDGKAIAVEDLGGATGALELSIHVTRNAATDPVYFDNYLMQIAVTIPQSAAKRIKADGGQIAMAGSDTQITFMEMPGKEGAFTIEADIVDFSMNSVSFAGVPLSMAIDSPDTGDLISGFDELGDGVDQINDGVSGIADGVDSLAGGIGQLADGADSLGTGAGQLSAGVAGAAEGVANLATGLLLYQQGLRDQASALAGEAGDPESAIASAITAYSQAYSAAFAAAYGAAFAQGSDPEAALASAAAAAAQDPTALSALQELSTQAATAGAAQGAAQALNEAADGLGSQGDTQSIIGGAEAVSNGMAQLESGANELAQGAHELANGAGEASSGASSLAQGSQELASGTSTLSDEVKKMPDEVQKEIDAMLAEYDRSDFVPPSFTSPLNTNVKLVQFVFSTEPIEAPETEIEEEPAVEKSIWERFLDLFA